MKKLVAMLFMFAMLFTLNGCSQESADTLCPQCSAKINALSDNFCSKCGLVLSESAAVEEKTSQNELIGAWLQHHEYDPYVDIYSFEDVVDILFVYDNMYYLHTFSGPYEQKNPEISYSIEGEQLKAHYFSDDEGLQEAYLDYSIQDDNMTMGPNSYTRLGSFDDTQTEFYGTWRVISPTYFLNFRDIEYVDFYQDGTMKITTTHATEYHTNKYYGRFSFMNNGGAVDVYIENDSEVLELKMMDFGIMSLTDEWGTIHVLALESSPYK